MPRIALRCCACSPRDARIWLRSAQGRCRLHGLLRDLLPGGVAGSSRPSGRRASCAIRPRGALAACAGWLLRSARVRTLDRKIADLNGRIEAEVEASGTTLTQIFGVGPILAATIIGTVGNVARFPTQGALRLLRRHGAGGGLKRGGGAPQTLYGRQPTPQLRPAHGGGVPGQVGRPGRAYYRKKIDEGKSRKEALRCLKRRISDAVFASLVADSQLLSRSAA